MVFLDGTYIRAQYKAAGAVKTGGYRGCQNDRAAPVRSHEGFGSKICIASDSDGKALSFNLTPGQAHELVRLDALPHTLRYTFCDRGYASNQFRKAL
ncbi:MULTISPECIES: transposase [Asaia]|uniref:transposase n=1 Tax=Asaia TaxID=91914 RepID=UPI002FC373C6